MNIDPSARPSRRVRPLLVVVPLVAGVLGAVAAPAQAAGGGAAGALTCRGEGIDASAVVRHRTETFIEAPSRVPWDLLTRVEGWPSWQEAVTGAERLDRGPLRTASRFRWTTPVPATPTTPATTLVITSSVEQVERGRCVRWTGPAIGDGLRIDEGVHVWDFVPVEGGVVVRTEESWTGDQVEADPVTATRYLASGLDTWLADLKATAEARAGRRGADPVGGNR